MNANKPFFSVVIPLHNKESYIGHTLDSVLNQNYQDFEVVVVNDGSTDNSLAVAQTFADSRIKIYSKPNGGVSSARNFGIDKARAPYIAFLDADDLWSPCYLEEMKNLIDRFPECGLYGCAYNIVEKKGISNKGDCVPEGIIDDYFRIELKHQISRTSSTIVKASVFEEVGGFPVGMIGGEDNYFFSMIAIKFPVAYSPKTLISYNKESDGISLRYGKKDNCKESWFDFYEAGKFYQNEYIAYKGIENAIRHALGLHRTTSLELEKCFRYTQLSKKRWQYLYLLNRLPGFGIKALNGMVSLKKTIAGSYLNLF